MTFWFLLLLNFCRFSMLSLVVSLKHFHHTVMCSTLSGDEQLSHDFGATRLQQLLFQTKKTDQSDLMPGSKK